MGTVGDVADEPTGTGSEAADREMNRAWYRPGVGAQRVRPLRPRSGPFRSSRQSRPSRRRHPFTLALVCLGSMCILVSACGASAGSPRSASVLATCQKVSAILSDGPDPTADPVGYAEAQILPLESVYTSDAVLDKKITDLDDVFREVYESNASATSMRALTRAESAVDAICPGATE